MDLNLIEYTDSQWRNLRMAELNVDEAYLQVISLANSNLWLYERSDSCFKCPFSLLRKINQSNHLIKLDVSQPLSLKIFDENQGKYDLENNSAICSFNTFFGEFGVYNLTISNNLTCSLAIDKNPVNIYLSLLTVFLILSCLCLVLKGYFIARSKFYHNSSSEANEEITPQPTKKRLKSLDLFRGLVIVLMIFVNSGGGKYWWIEHAPWNGLHLADIVFPSFLWIMGVCIPISIIAQLKRSIAKRSIFKNIISVTLLTVFLILSCLCLVLKGYFIARSKFYHNSSSEANEEITPQPTKKRLKSLDLFRGLVIVLMIFVNSGGGKYWWIEHAPWNGLHLADIVFPSFLWIMGVCIPISIIAQLKRSIAKRSIFKNIISRSLKLFSIGVCLNSINGPLLSELRIMGVLQRFGVCYLFCATVHLFCTNHRHIFTENLLHRTFVDIIILKSELILILCLIIINLAITLGLKRPGCPRGYLGPGGKQNYPSFVNCTGGIVGYIDEEVLGAHHIYTHATAKYLYEGNNFDPEGVFGCLLSTVQVFLGVQCGVLLTTFTDWKSKTIRILLWGISLILIGLILCSFSIEDGYIPINKNMWSLSFVFVTSGIAFLLFLFFYLIVDVKLYWSGYPFVECGMNAIVMYVGHSILHKMLPWHWRIGLMNTHFILLLESCWNTVLWIVIALYLYNKKIFYNL